MDNSTEQTVELKESEWILAVTAVIMEFFSDPYAPLIRPSEAEARWIGAEALRLALLSRAKPRDNQ